MVIVGNTVETLVSTANHHAQEIGGKTVEAFPDKYFSTPLKQTMFSLGIKKIEVGPRIEITNNDGTTTVTKNRNAIITFVLNVYAPHSMGGAACTAGFDKWMDCLVRILQINVIQAGCQEVEYDQSIGTNVLEGYFVMKRVISELTPAS
ncbi:MAG: hypothetical protein E7515_06565 [Ruminococcaceae bacterium]|jgi:hypothetical protein|nr:hypothetical protein [Oscillospiraceae bacterium]